MRRNAFVSGLFVAAATFLVELLLMELLGVGPLASLPAEMAALPDAIALGIVIGPVFFWFSTRGASTTSTGSLRSRVVDSIILSVLAIGFEGTLHSPLDTLTASMPRFVTSLLDAVIMAIVAGALATWLVYVRGRVLEQSVSPDAARGHANAVLAGAILAAVYVSAIPALSVFNNKMSWERTQGTGELVNLAGRQRMLGQKIGRLAMLSTNHPGASLKDAIAEARAEGETVDRLAAEFVQRFIADGSREGAHQLANSISDKRSVYLGSAAALAQESDPALRRVLNDRLQGQVDAFVPLVDQGVRQVQLIADNFSDRQSSVIPIRLVLGTVVLFSAVLGLIWPILRLVSAQHARLDARRIDAEAAAIAKSQFLANMSHELRTPLTAVIGFTALLERQEELSSESRRLTDRVAFGGRALLATINDLLDFSQLEAGALKITPRPTEPRQLLQNALSLFEALAGSKGLELQLTGLEDLPDCLMLDAGRTTQILMNLVGNAVKFTDSGRVDVHAAYELSTQTLSVSVRDTGPGITADGQQKLFLRFSQVDGSSTRAHSGSGLGLAICKGLVDRMNGEIGVTSRPGEGSTFWFKFPSEMSFRRSQEKSGASLARHTLEGCRVLVVDDTEANRQIALALLEAAGCEPVAAATGAEAIVLANSQPFDVILLDLVLPGLDGPAVALQLRKGGCLNANVPMLAFTADPSGGWPRDLFDGAVAKPFTAEELLGKLDVVLNSGVGDDRAA